jgi:hypothetical protein
MKLLKGHGYRKSIQALALSPDGMRAAAGSKKGWIFWDVDL